MYRRRGVTILSPLDTSPAADRFYPCSISNSTSVWLFTCVYYLFTNKSIAKKIFFFFVQTLISRHRRQNLQSNDKSLSDHHCLLSTSFVHDLRIGILIELLLIVAFSDFETGFGVTDKLFAVFRSLVFCLSLTRSLEKIIWCQFF